MASETWLIGRADIEKYESAQQRRSAMFSDFKRASKNPFSESDALNKSKEMVEYKETPGSLSSSLMKKAYAQSMREGGNYFSASLFDMMLDHDGMGEVWNDSSELNKLLRKSFPDIKGVFLDDGEKYKTHWVDSAKPRLYFALNAAGVAEVDNIINPKKKQFSKGLLGFVGKKHPA
ncbi:MAG: hypothetical protein COB76_03790 [Alphaproteobacteria bacterium]|nr:MAG: hypothetical protein COB76_03790 [Alphaproteobacteria bacterium]